MRHSGLRAGVPCEIERVLKLFSPLQFVQLCDSGSHLDYSGCRKTHRFPPPYGLGSHSLTHRPTENPTGMTKEMTAPHPNPPRAGEGAITLYNPSNYATLNQLCIQAHSSSLCCGGSLCKVQGDK